MSENQNTCCTNTADGASPQTQEEFLDEFLDKKLNYLCKAFMTRQIKNEMVKSIVSHIVGTTINDISEMILTMKKIPDPNNPTCPPILVSQEDTGFIAKIIREIIFSTKLNKYIRVHKVNVTVESEIKIINSVHVSSPYYLINLKFQVISVPSITSYIRKYDPDPDSDKVSCDQ